MIIGLGVTAQLQQTKSIRRCYACVDRQGSNDVCISFSGIQGIDCIGCFKESP